MNKQEKLKTIREKFIPNFNPMDLDLSTFGGSIFQNLWWDVKEGKLNLFSFKGGKILLTCDFPVIPIVEDFEEVVPKELIYVSNGKLLQKEFVHSTRGWDAINGEILSVDTDSVKYGLYYGGWDWDSNDSKKWLSFSIPLDDLTLDSIEELYYSIVYLIN